MSQSTISALSFWEQLHLEMQTMMHTAWVVLYGIFPSMQENLEHMPGAGHNDPFGSLPIWVILLFYVQERFSH